MTNFHKFDENEFDLKDILLKYFRFWPIFVCSVVICLLLCGIYIRYGKDVYKTEAKIKILEKNESLNLPSVDNLFSDSRINLENEIETIRSYPILEKVVNKLHLTYNFYKVGNIKTARIDSFPFYFKPHTNINQKKEQVFEFFLEAGQIRVYHEQKDSVYILKDHTSLNNSNDLPFDISLGDFDYVNDDNISYKLVIKPLKSTIRGLKKRLGISKIGKSSEIISISLNTESKKYSENIVDCVVETFNNDGIEDKRLVYRRTIDFINNRFVDLTSELDSIEIAKQHFKLNNNLVDIVSDASMNVGLKLNSDEKVFQLENQILIVESLLNSIKNDEGKLIPSNIGVESDNINELISGYNKTLLSLQNLIYSGGENNPEVINLEKLVLKSKLNILETIEIHKIQLDETLRNLKKQNTKFFNSVSTIPEKEKGLRSIERNQEILESLYLFLLQKREEAEVSYTVTEPSIKVVEFAISEDLPMGPGTSVMILASIIIGLIIPVVTLYLFFYFDNKVHSKEDLVNYLGDINLIGEIPNITRLNEKVFDDPSQRSIIAEASRILASNTDYLIRSTNPDKKGKVIISTSTIKGEGKTFVALNLSLALASLNKKVLLIGADLRNPQVHNYINENKSNFGLTNFLLDKKFDWKSYTINHFKKYPTHEILISGPLPPNPSQLLANGNLDILLEEAKNNFDYVILDCAPTILVSDTLLITHLADATVYLTRANKTEIDLLDFPAKLMSDKKLQNVGFVLNGVGDGYKSKYGYSYGYKYSYAYNYGYGYGYSEEEK